MDISFSDIWGDLGIWPWLFVAAWLAGAWALSLPWQRRRGAAPLLDDNDSETPQERRPRRGRPLGSACYMKINYSFPARSRRSFAEIFGNSPELKSLYLRAEFLLTYCAGLSPDQVLHKWAASPALADERNEFDSERSRQMDQVMARLRKNDVKGLYTPPTISPEKPLALGFPLLPAEFSLFVGTRISGVSGDSAAIVEQGIYNCLLRDWREDDGYGTEIEMRSPDGKTIVVDQTTIIDAIQLRKAVVEAVCFAGLPIYLFVSRSRPLPALEREQKVAQKLLFKPATARDYQALDARLLKLFGGVNPINLVRLSRFYHPKTGVKPDESKYRKLVGRARSAGLHALKGNGRISKLVPKKMS